MQIFIRSSSLCMVLVVVVVVYGFKCAQRYLCKNLLYRYRISSTVENVFPFIFRTKCIMTDSATLEAKRISLWFQGPGGGHNALV